MADVRQFGTLVELYYIISRKNMYIFNYNFLIVQYFSKLMEA